MIRIALTILALLLLPACTLTASHIGPSAESIQQVTAKYRYRSKITGQFVTAAYAKRHPKTTRRETIR